MRAKSQRFTLFYSGRCGPHQRETVMYTCQSMYTKPTTDIASRITDAVSTRSTIDLSGIHVLLTELGLNQLTPVIFVTLGSNLLRGYPIPSLNPSATRS